MASIKQPVANTAKGAFHGGGETLAMCVPFNLYYGFFVVKPWRCKVNSLYTQVQTHDRSRSLEYL
jgi:hypothetical protein